MRGGPLRLIIFGCLPEGRLVFDCVVFDVGPCGGIVLPGRLRLILTQLSFYEGLFVGLGFVTFGVGRSDV